jgi:hypothetical protein
MIAKSEIGKQQLLLIDLERKKSINLIYHKSYSVKDVRAILWPSSLFPLLFDDDLGDFL